LLVLFTYILWSILYLIILITFKIFFLKKLFKKNSKIIKLLLLLFYNDNLYFYKNELSFIEKQNINYLRYNKYSTLNLIHCKINFIFFKKSNKNLSFKSRYKICKYLSNKNLELNLLNNNFSNTINFSIIQNILKKNINNSLFNYYTILYYNIFKNSISSKQTSTEFINFKKLNINLNTNINNSLSIKLNTLNFTKKKIINFYNYLNYLNNFKFNLLSINNLFLEKLITLYTIRFSASNIVKYLSDSTVVKSNILFLRKNKVFNKSRYSRNRQTYRTGAYWCLYINIIAVVAFYFWFYNFTMNFGYVWWLLYSFILSFFLFKAIKFNFYNIKTLSNEIKLSIIWFYNILSQLIIFFLSYFIMFYNNQRNNILINNYLNLNKKIKIYKNFLINLNKINDLLYNKLN
jgi:hypothetical protein